MTSTQTSLPRTVALLVTSVVTSLALVTPVQADPVKKLMGASNSWLVAQIESQKRVDEYSSQKEDVDAEYQRLLRQIEGLEAYNRQLQVQVDAQNSEIARTDASISKATEVDRQLLPLLNSMVDTFAKLVEVSPPFSPKERSDRVNFLRETVDRADVAAAEKFRQVLDAYMNELNYGNTIEAYNDTIDVDGGEREVNILRLGRIGLYYQTADRLFTGRWDDDEKEWVELGPEFRNGVYEAIRVANKLTAPSLLSLPLPAPQKSSASSAKVPYRNQPAPSQPNSSPQRVALAGGE